jgi:uncharacterized membrane protein YgcG
VIEFALLQMARQAVVWRKLMGGRCREDDDGQGRRRVRGVEASVGPGGGGRSSLAGVSASSRWITFVGEGFFSSSRRRTPREFVFI